MKLKGFVLGLGNPWSPGHWSSASAFPAFYTVLRLGPSPAIECLNGFLLYMFLFACLQVQVYVNNDSRWLLNGWKYVQHRFDLTALNSRFCGAWIIQPSSPFGNPKITKPTNDNETFHITHRQVVDAVSPFYEQWNVSLAFKYKNQSSVVEVWNINFIIFTSSVVVGECRDCVFFFINSLWIRKWFLDLTVQEENCGWRCMWDGDCDD